MDINIGGTKSHLLAQLEAAVENIKIQPDGMVSYTIYGENALGSGDANLVFSDEDMDRPEVSQKILVEVAAY